MKITIQNKLILAIVCVVAIDLLLVAALVFWNGRHAAPVTAAGHAPAQAPDAHDGDDGRLAIDAQQMRKGGIATSSAGPAALATVVRLPGEVRVNDERTAHILPPVAGRVATVGVELGQRVRKGQVLAVIASPELAELRGAARAAQQRHDMARLVCLREQRLWQDKISSEQDYLQACQAEQEAGIAARSALAKLAALGAGSDGALNNYALRAPFDGAVIEKHITQGERVQQDSKVFVLSDLSTVWVDVVVPARQLDAVRTGAAATVRAVASDAVAQGKVGYVGAVLGEESRSAQARIVLANPQAAWRPGMFVNVEMAGVMRRAPVTVAAEAIQTVEGKPVVYARDAQGFHAQAVRTGASDGKLVEVLEGLRAGDLYVSAGSFVLKAEQGKGGAEHAD